MAASVGSYCMRYHWNMKHDPGSSFWVSDPWVPWRLLRCRNTAWHLKKCVCTYLIGRHIVEVEDRTMTGPDTLWMKLILAAGINKSYFVEYIWRLEDQWVCLQFLSTMTVSVTNTRITADATPVCPSISRFILPSLNSAVKLAICNLSRHVPWPQNKLQNKS